MKGNSGTRIMPGFSCHNNNCKQSTETQCSEDILEEISTLLVD